jgi:hypothetical protein
VTLLVLIHEMNFSPPPETKKAAWILFCLVAPMYVFEKKQASVSSFGGFIFSRGISSFDRAFIHVRS